MTGGDPHAQPGGPDDEPQGRAQLHGLTVDTRGHRSEGTDLQVRRGPGLAPGRAHCRQARRERQSRAGRCRARGGCRGAAGGPARTGCWARARRRADGARARRRRPGAAGAPARWGRARFGGLQQGAHLCVAVARPADRVAVEVQSAVHSATSIRRLTPLVNASIAPGASCRFTPASTAKWWRVPAWTHTNGRSCTAAAAATTASDPSPPATPQRTGAVRHGGLGQRGAAGGASMRPGGQVTRSWRDGITARRDRGRGSARAPHPQAGRPAALRLVLFRDRRAGGGRRRGQRHHVRRADRYRGREPPAAACAGCRGQSGGAVRPARPARGHGRPVARPAPVPAARRGGGHRRPGRRRDRGGQRPAHGARRQPALLCDHHGPPGHEPRRGARPLPGGPGRLRHHGRPGRPAVLAERPVGGDRRVRDRAGGSVAHLRAEPADHGARGPRDRPRRPVRRGLRVAAARRSGDRRRAGHRRPAGDRDTAGPPPGTPPGQPLTPLRGHSQGRRRQAGCRRVRPGPAGSRRLLPAVPEGAGARAGLPQRAAVGGPRGRAPGPAVLRGRGGGRAHAAAARRGPGRSRSRRAGL